MDGYNTTPIFKFALREDLKDQRQFLPTKAEEKATGWDVRVALQPGQETLTVNPMDYVKIPLGFRAFCPPGWWFELKPRSSTFAKKNLHALYGTIDETYEGELVFAAQYVVTQTILEFFTNIMGRTNYRETPNRELILTHGEAIGQIVPVRRQEMIVEAVSNEEYDQLCNARAGVRGAGGFGSTGK